MSSSRVAKSSSANSSSNSKGDARADKPRKVTARADELDAYMEKLYDEDIESKIDGAKMILQIAEFAGNIEALIQNEALMVRCVAVYLCVWLLERGSESNLCRIWSFLSLFMQCLLSRVLNDDYKKSNDFSLTMMRIFWCFSNFLQLHPILANYRIGAITLKIVEFEIKRHELRLEEEKLMEAAVTSDEAAAKLEREKKRNKKRMKKQDQLL